MFLTASMLLLFAAPLGPERAEGKLEPPTVRFQGLSVSGNPLFEVSNPNAAPLPFSGYANTKNGSDGVIDGKISPLYAVQLRQGEQWKEHVLGWCGTGTGPVTIPAKTKVVFEAYGLPAPGWEEIKIGLRWYATENRSGPAEIAWSNPILRRQVEKKAP